MTIHKPVETTQQNTETDRTDTELGESLRACYAYGMIASLVFYFLAGCTAREDPVDKAPKPPPIPELKNKWVNGVKLRHLMTFHACDTTRADCNDPWLHQSFIAGSSDGKRWEVMTRFEPFSTSVPDPIVRDNVLYVYGMPQQRQFDLKTGKILKSKRVEVIDENSDRTMNVDPSAILDDDGRIVLFYLVGDIGYDPATCPPKQPNCSKVFQSATEVDGSNGTRFKVDPGTRASIQLNNGARFASDPDIFACPNGYCLLISRGQGMQLLHSETLRGEYTFMEGLSEGFISKNGGGVGAGHYDSKSESMWFFSTKHIAKGNGSARMTEIHGSKRKGPIGSIEDRHFKAIIKGGDFLSSDYLVASPGFYSFPDSP